MTELRKFIEEQPLDSLRILSAVGRGASPEQLSQELGVNSAILDDFCKRLFDECGIETEGLVEVLSADTQEALRLRRKVADLKSLALQAKDKRTSIQVTPQDENLRADLARYELILEATQSGMWDLDLKVQSLYLTDSTYEVLGYEIGAIETTRAALQSLIHPDDMGKVTQECSDYLQTGEGILELIFRMRASDGKYRTLLCRAKAVLGQHGVAERAVGFIRDIGSWKRTATAMEQLPNFSERVAASTPDIIYVYDMLEKKHIYFNRSASEILGYSDDQLAAMGPSLIDQVVHPQDLQSFSRFVDAVPRLKDGEVHQHEFRIVNSNAEIRWLRDRFTPFERDASGQVTKIIGVSRDFTDDRRHLDSLTLAHEELSAVAIALEQRVNERTEELRDRNRDLEAFCYSISHDLRGPLRGIDGFSKLLSDEYGPVLGEEGKGYLRRIRAGIQRTGALMDALLRLVRITQSPVTPTPINLSEIGESVASELKGWQQQRNLEFVIQPDLTVVGDEMLLYILLDNLLRNAVKFTLGTETAKIELFEEREGAVRTFVVRDNGLGFEPAYAHKLFQPFERLHADHGIEGFGIGLHIVQRIVVMHDGEVSARISDDGLTEFRFTLNLDENSQI